MKFNQLVKLIEMSVDKTDNFEIIQDANAYKQATKIRRIPIAKIVDKDKETIIIGNDELTKFNAKIRGKEYMDDERFKQLLSDPVIIEEKVDGHPIVILFGGYTFYCESLKIKHTVEYDGIPYSQEGWPDMSVVYDIVEGEFTDPSKTNGKWLSRNEKEQLCKMVGAPLVNLIFSGKLDPINIPKIADKISLFGKSKIEGIVIKNLYKGIFGKFINLEFQRKISDENLIGQIHPMQRGERNIRKTHTFL